MLRAGKGDVVGCKDCGTDRVISELLGRCHRCQRLWREGMVRGSTNRKADNPPQVSNSDVDEYPCSLSGCGSPAVWGTAWCYQHSTESERTRSQRESESSSTPRQRSTSHWYDFDEDHWLWKKDDRFDTEWGWIIFWFVAAPICAMGGPFGVLLGGCSLAFAIWCTAKKLLK